MKKRLKYLLFTVLMSPMILCADIDYDDEDYVDDRSSHSEENVTVNEDLMQEHGLLNRILLVYEEMSKRLLNETEGPDDVNQLNKAANIIRTLLENHHEIMEETYIFPLLEEDGEYFDLVQVLRQQHLIGRQLTDFILHNSTNEAIQSDVIREALAQHLNWYVTMFRPHESREGTVVFPLFRTLITDEEYAELSQLVEEHEENLIGHGGFGRLIDEVADIEKALGIHDLSQFTPAID